MLDPWRRLSPRNRPAARRPRSRAPLRTLPRLLSSCLREERLNLLVRGTSVVVAGVVYFRTGSRLNFLAQVRQSKPVGQEMATAVREKKLPESACCVERVAGCGISCNGGSERE